MIIYRLTTAILRFVLRCIHLVTRKRSHYSENDFQELMGGTTYLSTAPCRVAGGDAGGDADGYIWFHVASVGEVRALLPLVNYVRGDHPSTRIAISTITSTGKGVAISEYAPDLAFILPVENTPALRRIFRSIRVKGVMVMDTELWPIFMKVAAEHTGVYLVNGRMSPSTARVYARVPMLFRDCLGRFTEIIAKSQADANLIRTVNKNIVPRVSYDLKILLQPSIIDARITDARINMAGDCPQWMHPIRGYFAAFACDTGNARDAENAGRVFLGASIHLGEEGFVVDGFAKARNLFGVLIIAPRHMHAVGKMATSIRQHGLTVGILSELEAAHGGGAHGGGAHDGGAHDGGAHDGGAHDVIIIDRFGVLDDLYRFSDKVVVGGSFLPKHSGHNIYEALVLGKRCAIGPYHRNFEMFVAMGAKHNLVDIICGDENVGYTFDGVGEGTPRDADMRAFHQEMGGIKVATMQTYADLIDKILTK